VLQEIEYLGVIVGGEGQILSRSATDLNGNRVRRAVGFNIHAQLDAGYRLLELDPALWRGIHARLLSLLTCKSSQKSVSVIHRHWEQRHALAIQPSIR